jgi:hypothetical protein
MEKVGGAISGVLRSKAVWSAIFQVGVFVIVTIAIMKLKDIKTVQELLAKPAYLLFAIGCGISIFYSLATGTSKLGLANTVLWVIIVISVAVMIWPHKDKAQQSATYAYATPVNYAPPLSYQYTTRDTVFSLDSNESAVFHFLPGKVTDWGIYAKKHRCGNDSLLIIGDRDTLRTWLPSQTLDGDYDSLTFVALAPMKNIKMTIRPRAKS